MVQNGLLKEKGKTFSCHHIWISSLTILMSFCNFHTHSGGFDCLFLMTDTLCIWVPTLYRKQNRGLPVCSSSACLHYALLSSANEWECTTYSLPSVCPSDLSIIHTEFICAAQLSLKSRSLTSNWLHHVVCSLENCYECTSQSPALNPLCYSNLKM